MDLIILTGMIGFLLWDTVLFWFKLVKKDITELKKEIYGR